MGEGGGGGGGLATGQVSYYCPVYSIVLVL